MTEQEMPGGSAAPGGLLALHAHPDDESLSTGALLATWAAAGRPVTVVTCTRGERGEVIPPELAHLADDPEALAAVREGELAGALAALGVADHTFLDEVGSTGQERFTDSGMAWAAPGRAQAADALPDGAFVAVPVEAAARRLATVLRDRRPQVVVGYEPRGGYGHPDHVHAHRVMHRAVELVDGEIRTPVVLWAALDGVLLAGGRRAISGRARGLWSAAEGEEPSAAVPPSAVDVRVEMLPVLDRVAGALAAHRTQVQALEVWGGEGAAVGCFALSNRVLQPLLRHESYRRAPGSAPMPATWPAGVRATVA